MKQSTKPISSPGRNENFPPPLMRFLRNNAASRSRGRSRSTTIFPRKKNNTIETQEPSSPKVTCMGQVRVTRSSKLPGAKRGCSEAVSSGRTPSKFRWLPNPLFCYRLKAKWKHCSSSFKFHCHCQPFCPNWDFFRRRKGCNSNNEDSTKPKVNFRGRHKNYETDENETEEEDETEQQEQRASVSYSYSTPPRNALLLMRCRSEPYRSSSLASRFWGTPLKGEEEKRDEQSKVMENRENREYSEKQKPLLQRESILEQEGSEDPKLEQKLRFFKELEDSLRERIMETEKGRDLKRREGTEEGDSALPRPMVLTRCKSEPARIARKFDAEVHSFWKKKRMGL